MLDVLLRGGRALEPGLLRDVRGDVALGDELQAGVRLRRRDQAAGQLPEVQVERGQEAQTLPAFLQSHGSKIQGAFAVDGGDTALLGTSLAKYGLVGKVKAGGFDLEPQTLTAVNAGQIDFTVDQSPYLQGFLPTIYLYLWQLSGGLVAPPETNTGLKFVTKSNVSPYISEQTRSEGSTSQQKYIKHSGAIST